MIVRSEIHFFVITIRSFKLLTKNESQGKENRNNAKYNAQTTERRRMGRRRKRGRKSAAKGRERVDNSRVS